MWNLVVKLLVILLLLILTVKKQNKISVKSIMHCESSAWIYWMLTELVYWSAINDKQVTLVISATMTKVITVCHVYLQGSLINTICGGKKGYRSLVSYRYYQQPTRNKQAEVTFSLMLLWLYLLSFELAVCHDTMRSAMPEKSIAGLCEAISVKQANLPTRKTVKATFIYPQYWWSNHIENMN